MSKKTELPLRIAPLQRVIAQPITDPAEQAALDKFRKRLKQKQAGQAKMPRPSARDASNSVAKKRG